MAMPTDDLRDRLAALPEPPLPPGLLERTVRARQRQRAMRRAAVAGAGTTVLVAIVAVSLPMRLQAPAPAPVVDAPPPIAAATSTATTRPERNAQLRILDREIQAAYRRGSGEAELAQLWKARAELEGGREAAASVRPFRI